MIANIILGWALLLAIVVIIGMARHIRSIESVTTSYEISPYPEDARYPALDPETGEPIPGGPVYAVLPPGYTMEKLDGFVRATRDPKTGKFMKKAA